MASQVDRALIPWYEAGNLSAIAPPPGETSNFLNPYSRAYLDVLTQSVCMTVATLAITMRMYTKMIILRNPGWDDYTATIGYMLLITFGAVCLVQDHHGNGRHLWNLTGYEFVAYAKAVWVNEIIYTPAMLFTKLSIFLLYLRVFNPIMRTSVALYVILWMNVTFYFCGAFVEAFQCMPVAKAWYPLLGGQCISQQAAQISSAAINAVSDFVILILPAGSIWNLHIRRQGKIGLFVIFSFGILGCVASVSRFVLFATHGAVTHNSDATWVLYPLNLLSTAEITCGLICSCLPALPAFLRHVSGLKIRVIISNEKSRHPGINGYQSYPPDPRSPRAHGHPHRHRDARAGNGVNGGSKILTNNLQSSSLSPSDSASKANSGSTNPCSHCTHCQQKRPKALTTTTTVPVSPLPEDTNIKERKTSSIATFFFSPPSKSRHGSPRQAQFALNSIGGRPLPPLPPASGTNSPSHIHSPRNRSTAWPQAAVSPSCPDHDAADRILPVSPVLSPTSGRDPYDELDALAYEDGDEWRSPSEAALTPGTGTGIGVGVGNRWNDGAEGEAEEDDERRDRDYFGPRAAAAVTDGGEQQDPDLDLDLEKGTKSKGTGTGAKTKLSKMGFRL